MASRESFAYPSAPEAIIPNVLRSDQSNQYFSFEAGEERQKPAGCLVFRRIEMVVIALVLGLLVMGPVGSPPVLLWRMWLSVGPGTDLSTGFLFIDFPHWISCEGTLGNVAETGIYKRKLYNTVGAPVLLFFVIAWGSSRSTKALNSDPTDHHLGYQKWTLRRRFGCITVGFILTTCHRHGNFRPQPSPCPLQLSSSPSSPSSPYVSSSP